jgi:P-type Ca2+ transporter type 2C
MTNWYRREPSAAAEALGVDLAEGLSEAEAARRRMEYGTNELTGKLGKSPWRILWEQLTALMVVILIIAAVVSGLLGDLKDAIAISAIVVLNALLGFSQEYRAEMALAALKKLAVPSVRVRRSGTVEEISAAQLVPGDIVLLEAGNAVAADCRLLECAELEAQEAALTGESMPIHKVSTALPQPDLALGDRRNMVYLGTFITSGRGQGVVTSTGMHTELGRIAGMIQTVERQPTPLQRRLDHLAKALAAAAGFLVAVIFLLGFLRGEEIMLLVLTAVSIAVAAVPEGLPAVVTIALTLGAQRMLGQGVLIRKLPAVETLGSVTVICTDKTGTLTENRMAAAVLQLADRKQELGERSQSGPSAIHDVDFDRQGYGLLLAGGALCNDAITRSEEKKPGSTAPLGDPTEMALAVAAARFGLQKAALDRAFPRVAEVPFTSARKRMTTVHRVPREPNAIPAGLRTILRDSSPGYLAFTKGSVESVLGIASTVWVGGEIQPLDQPWRNRLLEANDRLAQNGMRVLGVGFRLIESLPPGASGEMIEGELTFVGMVGIIDPPRPEVAKAVATCKAAGILPVMITGDHPLTAQYIARELGIDGDKPVITGSELDRVASGQLDTVAESASVYARVSPEHKLKLVEALQRRRQVVAMTGDGVNDAPALKRADIGIAMGVAGTDVAKEAADMVLLDDNFATIVTAVKEGRVIYDNVRKFIRYILGTNSGEIWTMLIAPLLGMPLPLLPLQILWMNLVTDGLPALALGVEPAESDVMSRPPYRPEESIFARGMTRKILWVGVLMALLALGLGYYFWRAGDPNWQTLLFTTLTLSQMANVMTIRSERRSLFAVGLFSNKLLLGAVGLTIFLQLALIYTPFLEAIFHTTPLPLPDLLLTAALSLIVFAAGELEKWAERRRTPKTR